MNEGRWNLDVLYTGFDSGKFKRDMARLEAVNGLLAGGSKKARGPQPEGKPHGDSAAAGGAQAAFLRPFRLLPVPPDGGYLRRSDAASANGRVNMLSGAAARAMSEITRYIASISIDDLDEAIAGEPGLDPVQELLPQRKAEGTQHLLTGDGEDVAANVRRERRQGMGGAPFL